MTKHIIPQYKLILFYNPIPGDTEAYYNFVMNEMIPAAHDMELYIFQVFHTLWGDPPLRQTEFVAESLDTVRYVLGSDEWQALEEKLAQYVTDYRYKIVPFRRGFQL
jgi:hypothetical protein